MIRIQLQLVPEISWLDAENLSGTKSNNLQREGIFLNNQVQTKNFSCRSITFFDENARKKELDHEFTSYDISLKFEALM